MKQYQQAKRIYIAGAGGMLGEAFFKLLNDNFLLRCTDIDVNADWLEYVDFRSEISYKNDVKRFKPDYLFHIGAHTDLEYCERNPEDAYLTNTQSVMYAVQVANELNIPILYISTAGIFDGKKKFYHDWDTPNPLCVYAKSKYLGEQYVVAHAKTHLVCRAGWMMGGGEEKDKKFVNKILKQLRDGQKELFVVGDKDGTPTYTHDFVRNVMALIQHEYWGLYNMVCEGQTSRYEVAEELLRLLNLENSIVLNKVTSSYFSGTYFAPRPSSERLVNSNLELKQFNLMRHWKLGLRDYLDMYFSTTIDVIASQNKQYA